MPDWNEAEKDEFGFPLTKKGMLSSNQKLEYLLHEVITLQKRIQSLENSLETILMNSK